VSGCSDLYALLVLEEKFDGKKTSGRPRKTDDVIQWIQKKKYDKVERLADWWRKMTHQLYDIEDGSE